MSDALSLSACDVISLYRRRQLSPVEVVEATLRRAADVNDVLNAVVTLAPEQALERAREHERAYGGAGPLKPLGGIPVTVKDTIPTAGIRTTYGSLLFRDHVPSVDAPVVSRIRSAGAILVGKTNTPEFGWKAETSNRVFGSTGNPWNPSRTPGGSSGGAAAAVASQVGAVGLGSDAAGSIRIPAAFTGILGFKPSFGLIPVAPNGPFESLAHVGLATRYVEDAALVLENLAGPHPGDRFSNDLGIRNRRQRSVRDMRFAWTEALVPGEPDHEVARLARDGAEAFREAGARVDEVQFGFEDPHDICYSLLAAAHAGMHNDEWAEVKELLDPGRAATIEYGRTLSAADLCAYMTARAVWVQAFVERTARYDLVLSPTVPVTAFASGLDSPMAGGGPSAALRWTPYTPAANLTGQPAASVPCGLSGEGLPIGLQMIGRRNEDLVVLQAAAAYQRVRPWQGLSPPLPGEFANPPRLGRTLPPRVSVR
jgi:aspartyl-tRNA(Asn)/glutamyl-tRNA(Gln) amidotransferase subunit A